MSQGHLRFDVKVDSPMRRAELFPTPGMGVDPVLANAGPTLVTLDCAGMTLPHLTRLINPAGKGAPRGSPPPARWSAASERGRERYPSEGSSLLLVGMEREHAFGYVHITAIVQREPGDVCLCVRVHRVSIHVPERATAYTLDLALAAGVLGGDVLVALYSSVPYATTIASEVRADSGPESCALVARQIHRALTRRVGHLSLQKRRPSVALTMPNLQASSRKNSPASLPAF